MQYHNFGNVIIWGKPFWVVCNFVYVGENTVYTRLDISSNPECLIQLICRKYCLHKLSNWSIIEDHCRSTVLLLYVFSERWWENADKTPSVGRRTITWRIVRRVQVQQVRSSSHQLIVDGGRHPTVFSHAYQRPRELTVLMWLTGP